MTIAELTRLSEIDFFVYDSPNILRVNYNKKVIADYWTTVFNAPDEEQTNNTKTLILDVLFNYTTRFNQKTSLAAMQTEDNSFYYDFDTETLYIHVDGFTIPDTQGIAEGYSDTDAVYIEDIEYKPYIKSAPQRIKQEEDLIDYDQLSFINGSILFDNTEGKFDNLIDNPIYGNKIALYNLPDDEISIFNTLRSSLIPIASFYVERPVFTLSELRLYLQDLRKNQNIKFPFEIVTDAPDENINGKLKPYAYGSFNVLPGVPVDRNGPYITYRIAQQLYSYGTVQYLKDGAWFDAVVLDEDLENGEITLTNGVTDSNGISDIRVFDVETHSTQLTCADIIKYLNADALGIQYNSSNYNTSEFESEETSFTSGVGLYLDSQKMFFQWIQEIQKGSDKRFRYEYDSNGLITIRIDDNSRTSSGTIYFEEIQNGEVVPVEGDPEKVYPEIIVEYNRNYYSKLALQSINRDNYNYSVSRYRQLNSLVIPSLIKSKTLADIVATEFSEKYKDIPNVVQLTLQGNVDRLSLKIYQIYNIVLSPGFVDLDTSSITGREYYGINRIKILSIDPKPDIKGNVITGQLLD
jgi:hypothetical protein